MPMKDQEFPSSHPKQSGQNSRSPRLPIVAGRLNTQMRQDSDQAIELVIGVFLSKKEMSAGMAVRVENEETTTMFMHRASAIPHLELKGPDQLSSSPTEIQGENENRQQLNQLAQILARQLGGLKETGRIINEATRNLSTGVKRLNRGMNNMKHALDQLDSSLES